MLWITDGKQMKQTIVPHPRNMAGVPYAPEQILKLVVFQSDIVKGPTVVAWGINFVALCSVPVVVVVPT